MNKKYKLIKKKWNSGCAFQKKIMMMTFFPQKKIFVMFSKKFLMRTFLFKENSSDQQKNLPSFKENYCASLLFSNDFFLSLLKSPPKIVVLFKKKINGSLYQPRKNSSSKLSSPSLQTIFSHHQNHVSI